MKRIIAITALLCMLCQLGFAADGFAVTYRNEVGYQRIYLDITAAANKTVSILAAAKALGTEACDFDTLANTEICYMAQKRTSSAGRLEVMFNPGVTGEIFIRIKDLSSGQHTGLSMTYYSETYIDGILADISAKVSAGTAITAEVESIADVCRLDDSLYKLSNKSAILSRIAARIKNTQQLKSEDFADIYYQESFLVYIGGNRNGTALSGVMNNSYMTASLALAPHPVYNDMGASKSMALSNAAAYARVDSIENFRADFVEQCAVAAVNSAETFDVLKDYLTTANDVFGISLAALNGGSYNREILNALLTPSFSSAAAVTAAFNTATTPSVTTPPKNTGGGSGGGGGSIKTVVTMPQTALVEQPIVAEAEAAPEEITGFNDLIGYEWASKAIIELSNIQVVNGYGDGTYRPANSVSREEFVKLITVAFKLDDVENTDAFADVSDDRWSIKYVSAAYGAGLINGKGEGLFDPEGTISREEMALILYRTARKNGAFSGDSSNASFTDISELSQESQTAIAAMQRHGIIKGMAVDSFRPHNNLTRAETAQAIYRLLEVSGGGGI